MSIMDRLHRFLAMGEYRGTNCWETKDNEICR